jgi:hypothetical protein
MPQGILFNTVGDEESPFKPELNVCTGSTYPLTALIDLRPEAGVKQSKPARTSVYRKKAAVIGRHSGRQGIAEGVEEV